jgi:predicted metal-binding protein
MKEYTNGLLVYCQMPFKEEEYKAVRTESTNLVHKALLNLEKVLWDQNYPLAVSYIGGSCKLCKNGCAADHCRNPYLSRIPIEATGINLITTLKKVGIEIAFPVTDCLSRYGLLLW